MKQFQNTQFHKMSLPQVLTQIYFNTNLLFSNDQTNDDMEYIAASSSTTNVQTNTQVSK